MSADEPTSASASAAAVSLIVIGCFSLVILVRVVQIYQQMQRTRRQEEKSPAFGQQRININPCKTLVVLGSGGHTSEMLHMVKQLSNVKYSPISYVVAATDHTSVQRLEATKMPQQQSSPNNNNKFTVHVIPRSREVGQSYASSLITTLYALVHSIVLVLRIRPALLLTNGPGTCVPIVLGCWILRILGWPCTIVFCESYCRVETLSLSGKLLYPLVDCFLVHWESLHDKYPQSYRLSTFVKKDATVASSLSSSKTKKSQ